MKCSPKNPPMTLEKAAQIRSEYQNTTIKQFELAKKYDTSQRTVSMIVNNKSFNRAVTRPNSKVLYRMQLQMVTLWVEPKDLPAVMAYDKTRAKP